MEILRLLLLPVIYIGSTKANLSTRKQMGEYLLDNNRFDADIRPDFESGYPTNISIQIRITALYSVNEHDMEYSVDMVLRQSWRDPRLAFPKNSTLEKLELDPKDIDNVWKPDNYFMNEKRATVHAVPGTNSLMQIFRNGTVVYSIRIAVTFVCNYNLRFYPFDDHRCPIIIQSYSYTSDSVKLHWWPTDPIYILEKEMPQYELSNIIDPYAFEMMYDLTGSFSTLQANIKLSRKYQYCLFNVFLPTSLIVLVSWLQFWIDIDSVAARATIGVTSVLTMIAQNAGTLDSLPPVSYFRVIDMWMFVCLCLVYLGLLEFVLVRNLMQIKNKKPKTVDTFSRIAFPIVFTTFVSGISIAYALAPGNQDTDDYIK